MVSNISDGQLVMNESIMPTKANNSHKPNIANKIINRIDHTKVVSRLIFLT